MESQSLPFPVAVLRRRSFNAKSAKDRHDSAYFAWEVSVRLGAVHASVAEPSVLAAQGLGAWARLVPASKETFQEPALRAVAVLLGEEGRGTPLPLRQTTPRAIIDALPAYRNRVVAHGSVREQDFYARAGDILLAALDDAWAHGFFLPQDIRLVYVESVEVTEAGTHRGRVFDMSGEAPLLLDPRGTVVPDSVRAGRLFALAGERWTSLHPWLLHLQHAGRERVLCFDSISKGRARYLDYASGVTLSGSKLDQLFPGIAQALQDALAGASEEPAGEEPEGEGSGRRFGDFRILGKLGQGAMGVVYLARQESLGRLTALKMLPADTGGDETAVARFRREVEAISRCEHPNVVNILTYGEVDGTHYYAMEYVEGAPLGAISRALSTEPSVPAAISSASGQLRAQQGALLADLPEAAEVAPVPASGRDRYRDLAALIRDAALGLHELHEAGVIHRDIKPDNIMVTARDHRAVVMDLGLAQLSDASQSLTKAGGSILGTLRYMPPEQLQMDLVDVDRRVDVYALGATLFELVTGQPLFDGDTMAHLVEQVLRDRTPSAHAVASAVPRDLSAVVSKATAKDPRDRYASAAAMAEDLEAFLAGRPVAARAPTLGYVLGLTVRRHPWRALGVVALLVTTIGAGLWFLNNQREARLRETTLRMAAEESLVRAEDLTEFMLIDLGNDLEKFGRLSLLEKAARRAKAYYDALPVEGAPWITLRGRGLAYTRIARVFHGTGDAKNAMEATAVALSIWRKRLAAEPLDQDTTSRLVTALQMRGRAFIQRRDLDQALPLLLEARDAVLPFLKDETAQPGLLEVLAITYGDLGTAADLSGEGEEALRNYREAVRLSAELRAGGETPNATMLSVGAEYEGRVAGILRERGDMPTARTHYANSLRLAEAALKERPGSANEMYVVSNALSEMGRLALEVKDLDAAEGHYTRFERIVRTLLSRDATNERWGYSLIDVLRDQSSLEELRDALEKATGHLDEALIVAAKIRVRLPDSIVAKRYVMQVDYELARMKRKRGLFQEAEAHLERQQVLYREVLAEGADSPHMRFGLYYSLFERGDLLRDMGRRAEAAPINLEALEIVEALHKLDGANVNWTGALADQLALVGDDHNDAGRNAEADRVYARAQTLLEGIASESMSPSVARSLTNLQMRMGWRQFEDDAYVKSLACFRKAVAMAEAHKLGSLDFCRQWARHMTVAVAAQDLLTGARKPTSDADHLRLMDIQTARAEYHPEAWVSAAEAYRNLLPPTRAKAHPEVGSLLGAITAADAAAGQTKGGAAAAWIDLGLRWLALHVVRAPDAAAQIQAGEPTWKRLRADARFAAAAKPAAPAADD